MKLKLVFLSVLCMNLLACSHGNCRAQGQSSEVTKSTEVHSGVSKVSPAQADKVKVYKPDGSLQCGQGKAIPLADMQKELGDIKVYSSFNRNDGLMRIQVCGAPTGHSNVYEIDRKDLEQALKKGFKEWTF